MRSEHGYDNMIRDMSPGFFAFGPRFKRDFKKFCIETVDLYALMCRIMDVEASPNDGRFSRVAPLLKSSGKDSGSTKANEDEKNRITENNNGKIKQKTDKKKRKVTKKKPKNPPSSSKREEGPTGEDVEYWTDTVSARYSNIDNGESYLAQEDDAKDIDSDNGDGPVIICE